jgi:hypothetical protein
MTKGWSHHKAEIERLYRKDTGSESGISRGIPYYSALVSDSGYYTVEPHMASGSPNWDWAKELIEQPPDQIGDCEFVLRAEESLKQHKDKLEDLRNNNSREGTGKDHKAKYVATIKDCNELQTGIQPSWYTYLLEIMDLEE